VTYAPARFLFDFLRAGDISHADVRWFGLTPAQYGMMLMAVGGAYVLWRLRHAPPAAQGEESTGAPEPTGEPAEHTDESEEPTGEV